MEFHSIGEGGVNFNGFLLIVPSVSVGNVGQLTCDLMVNSLRLSKLGYVWSTCVLPVVGSNAFSEQNDSSLTLSLEVFGDSSRRLAIMQQRSPIVHGKQREFTKHLIEWIISRGFSEVILLTSCHAYERKDEEIRGSAVKFLVQSGDTIKRELSCENLLELKRRKNEFGKEIFFMPGGGNAKMFHEQCIESAAGFNSVILMIFCSEGDNIPEAVSLAKVVNLWKKYLSDKKEKKSPWVFPSSWKHLFGTRQPPSIF